MDWSRAKLLAAAEKKKKVSNTRWDGCGGGDIDGGKDEQSCRYELIGDRDYLSHYLPVTLTMFINMQFIRRIKGRLEGAAMDGVCGAICGDDKKEESCQ